MTRTMRKDLALIATLLLWAAAAWLLFPLINLDRVEMSNAKPYLYRSALGLTILIIFFGKTLFDLFHPWSGGKKLPRLNAILLALYASLLTGGIVFMIVRMAVLAMKSRTRGPVI